MNYKGTALENEFYLMKRHKHSFVFYLNLINTMKNFDHNMGYLKKLYDCLF